MIKYILVIEECSITSPLYFFPWNHYIFNLDYLYLIKRGIFSLCISPCRRGHNLWRPSRLLPCFWFLLTCAHVGLLWVLHLWARVEWNIHLLARSPILPALLTLPFLNSDHWCLNNSILRLNYIGNLYIIFFDFLCVLYFKHVTAENPMSV